MTCRTCRHAVSRPSVLAHGWVLWCSLHSTLAVRLCGSYEREPGADDE